MAKVALLNLKSEKVGEIDLNDEVFGVQDVMGYPECRGIQARGISPDRVFGPGCVHGYRARTVLGYGAVAGPAARSRRVVPVWAA
jgi:hypothetical protein